MSYTIARRALALVCFLASLATYLLTLAPTIGFWRAGELAAAAWWQQIPQPIVGPLWLVLARSAQIVSPGDAALGAGFLSAFASAATAAFVALVATRLVDRWHPTEPEESASRALPSLIGGLVAALVFAWGDTQWSVSISVGVEPVGTLLAAIALYAALLWDAESERRGAVRWLLVTAYAVGLIAGLDSRFLLIVPAIALIIFNRRYDYTASTVATLVVLLTAGWFLFIDGLLREWMPALIDGADWLTIIGVPLLVLAAWLMSRSQARTGASSVVLAASAVALLGASTVAWLPIRHAARPPIDAIDTRGREPIALYLRLVGGEEQVPLWPRKLVSGSSLDESGPGLLDQARFFWGYQVEHLFVRYLFWNYVGRASDEVGAPSVFVGDPPSTAEATAPIDGEVFPVRFYALPLILAIVGFLFHVRHDWRMALVLLLAFATMGLGVVVVANLQQPQVRERDHLFVGALMITALWTGLGAARLARWRRSEQESGENEAPATPIAAGLLCLAAAAVPMLVGGWNHHHRSTDWVAWDYAYNLLQSCDSNAILLTAGDNDTFPLLYLQSAEGIRADVRVVNLAMANDPSYLDRLRTETAWSAASLPIGPADSLLGDSAVQVSLPEPVAIELERGRMPGDSGVAMRWLLRGPAVGQEGLQMVRLQERMIVDLLRKNRWKRPVYFSSGVAPNDRAGLDEHLIRSGLALRIEPARQSSGARSEAIDAARMRRMLLRRASGDADHEYAFRFRGLGPGGGYLPREARQIVAGYRYLFMLLAEHELNEPANPQGARSVLDEMDRVIPAERHAMPYWVHARIATLRDRSGDSESAAAHARAAIAQIDGMGEQWHRHPQAGAFHPIETKVRMLAFLGQYDEAIDTYERLRRSYPLDHNLRAQIEELRVERHLRLRDTVAALRELEAIISGYNGASDPALRNSAAAFEAVRSELKGE